MPGESDFPPFRPYPALAGARTTFAGGLPRRAPAMLRERAGRDPRSPW